ncbi:MAG: enterochelin esterase [Terriglobia bacterium]
MSAIRTSTFAFLILMLSSATPAATETELAVGKAQEGALAAGKPQSYALMLNAWDFVEVELEPHGAELVIIAYDPSGSKARGAKLGPDGGKIAFVAETTGRYRLEVTPGEKAKEGTYTITLDKIVTLADRLAPATAKYESPRIKILRAAVESGKRGSAAAFWDEVKKKGAPLIEPLQGDEKNMLVTFLWKGTPGTQNVFVLWFPFTDGPDDYHMTRLGETDVWYKTVKVDKRKRFMYRLAPNIPRPRGAPEGPNDDVFAMTRAAGQPDSLNPKRWGVDPADVNPPQYQGFSAVEMPEAPVQPWLAPRQGVPTGSIEKHQLRSALLKNEREIAVYLPPGYSKSEKPYGLMVLFDEGAYLGDKKYGILVPTPTILDNLISEKRIPPMIAVLVDNAPGARSRDLACNPNFADFLNFELVPWARRLYNVTTDPHQTVVAGSSLGGLAAAYAGLRHPETFGNILSQSGSYWWTPPKSCNPSDFDPDAEPNWMAKQFIASPRLPLRFYLDAGSDEIDLSGPDKSILLNVRNLRDVLLAKGYEVHYQEFPGGHDYLSWRGTLADGLILLMGGGCRIPEDQLH